MTTIVRYADGKRPVNGYSERIISPARAHDCCFTDMEAIGQPHMDDRWVYQYKRCRQCGFAVREIVRAVPDAHLAAALREILATAFQRNGLA